MRCRRKGLSLHVEKRVRLIIIFLVAMIFYRRKRGIAAVAVLAASFALSQSSSASNLNIQPAGHTDGVTWPVTPSANDSRQELERVFATPGEVATGLYWYWVSGNVSPEGVVADVRSMKQAGITRAYIGFQGLGENEAPRGPVRIQTPEWYECVRAAMRTAAEEGIEIGVFNCPGWSQSGGPWVSPEQSQRYLATVETEVAGPGLRTIELPRPANYLEDVKVLATRKLPLSTVSAGKDSISAENVTNLRAMFDGDPSTSAGFTSDKASVTIVPAKKDFTLRSVVMRTATPVRAVISVKALQNGEWKDVGTFGADRTNMMIEVGYDILAPTAAALPETKGDAFRIDFQINQQCLIPELAVSEEPVVNVYADQILSKMFQTPLPFWEQYKWAPSPAYSADAVVSEKDVVDLTAQLDGDRLTWDVPEGEWVVTRTYMAPANVPNSPALEGDGKGLEIDRWNPDVLKHHYDSFIGDIMRHVPAEERTTWKYIVSDSYERATQNFGDDFVEYFKSHFGYDPTPYLLTFNGTVVGSADLSERFLWDVRRMIADRLAYDHIAGLRDMANKDGMKLWLEPYGHWGFPGEFLMYGGQSDEVAGEFWSEGSLGDIENRAASSAAHIYGKGKCWAESFTCGGHEFSRSPRTMKQRGDRFFTEGINATLLHFMVSQPDETRIPGINCPFGNEFNRKNTWFSHLDLFTDYLKRANHMLQQGNYVADVAYFIGEDAPVMTGTVTPSLPQGFQYDFINAEVIEKALTADACHRLTLPHGTSYRILVLPPLKTMRPGLLRKIKTLVEDGAVVLGPKPLRSPSMQNYPQADAEVREIADYLWGEGEEPLTGVRKIGKGMVMNGLDMQQAFDILGITPDFTHSAGKDADIKYAHLSTPDRDIYFIANQQEQPREFSAMFRDADGRQPELWNAVDGSHRLLPAFGEINGRMNVPMRLEPMESVFIVFEKNAGGTMAGNAGVAANFPEAEELITVSTPWKVTLTPLVGKGKSFEMKKLQNLTLEADDYVKHFSGTATYKTTVKLPMIPEGKRLLLDLGNVREMAKVKVNGKYAGGVWTPPYTLDVTDLLKKGKNEIEIDVVNTWVNRLIGDSRLPDDERETWSYYRTHSTKTPLQPSGLLEDVKILVK